MGALKKGELGPPSKQKTKDISVKAFNMTTNKDEASCCKCNDCKCKFNSTACNSKQKWNNKMNAKTIVSEQKSSNPSTCICENSKYLKSVAYPSVTECDEIVTVIDNLPTKKTYTIATNTMSTTSINCYNKKIRDCHILHTVLLAIILLLIITIICYHYPKQKGKT